MLGENMIAKLSFTMLMISLPGLHLASGVFIDFQLATSDPNHLTLECVSSVTGDVDREATIFFFNSPNADRPIGRIFSGGIFDVTPVNEAFLRCTSGDGREQSDFVAIAAVPTLGDDLATISVFNGVPTELTCPIPLGELADHLDPYTFSWEAVNQEGFSVPVAPSQYSNNNRTLTIFVNDTTHDGMYHCVLRLRRCDITRSNGSSRCPVLTFSGSRTQFQVFERSRVITPPNNQEIRADEVARFVCVGVGSFINISWQYDDTMITDDAVIATEHMSEGARQHQIASMLLINTSMLQLRSDEYAANIACILRQNIPPEHNLQGRDDLIFSARLVVTPESAVSGGDVAVTDSTSSSGGDIAVTESTEHVGGDSCSAMVPLSALICSIIVTILLAAIINAVTIIVLLTYQKRRTKAGEPAEGNIYHDAVVAAANSHKGEKGVDHKIATPPIVTAGAKKEGFNMSECAAYEPTKK